MVWCRMGAGVPWLAFWGQRVGGNKKEIVGRAIVVHMATLVAFLRQQDIKGELRGDSYLSYSVMRRRENIVPVA